MFIDVDRHILMEITSNNKAIDRHLIKATESLEKAKSYHDKNIALENHLVGEIREISTGKGKEASSDANK